MKLHQIETKAKHLIPDVFIFLEKENRFYFIDDIDNFEEYVILYFEPSAFDHVELKLKNEESVKIISDYEIDTKMLENDLRERFDNSDFKTLVIAATNGNI